MAVDAEKASDRLECAFLVLKAYGFSVEIITMIQTISKSPAAQVYSNGTLFIIIKYLPKEVPGKASLYHRLYLHWQLNPWLQKIGQTDGDYC